PITFVGFKDVHDDTFHDPWADTSTLFSRLYAGHLGEGEDPADARLATGILRIDRIGFGRLLASIRAHGAGRLGRLAATARWGWLFTAGVVGVYAGPAQDGQPDFPSPRAGTEPFQGFPSGEWHEVPERPGLERRILPVRARDGRLLTLHHVRRAGAAAPAERGPVLLGHGTGVRANLFYTPPLRTTLVDVLLDAGHDVWLESWRGSIDLDTCEYTLDQVAVHDHPALVEAVLEETGAETLKAVVHCQGSTSMTMAALAGLLPRVTEIVSNAVSLHVELVPRSKLRLEVLVPVMKPVMPGMDPQWAIRPPGLRTSAYARFAELVRRECDNHVCAVANFTYGPGPDVLWRHENLTAATHQWISREFGWVPTTFFSQMGKCADAGHLVPVDDSVDGLPDDFLAAAPPADTRFTLLAGAENRCFLPAGQRRTHAWLNARRPGVDELHVLPGYTHMDVFFGRDAARDVFPRIVAALAR
ncbi:MAG: hypothetical protein QOH72_3012, partial [Solirubrobacteraceae bacterium]|nr:hypothetical protein [Solirubrobacteraceae bacterium]